MNTNPHNFAGLQAAGFDYVAIFHADAILHHAVLESGLSRILSRSLASL